MIDEQEWRNTYQFPGGIAECKSPQWLLNGCPICGCTEWQVTNDGWAYCDDCKKGFPTSYGFTHRPLMHWGKKGLTCFMCKDTGITSMGELCEECPTGPQTCA